MGSTTFLINDDLWQTLSEMIKSAHQVDAAVAYFGTGGAKLFPLRRGHCLIVDMSPASVKAGTTNPYEIAKLMRRGVKVFSRRGLHAKVVVADNQALIGSANISRNSRDSLDEAAVLTKEPSVIRRAHEFLERICTEPIRPEYLKRCKSIYKSSRRARTGRDNSTASKTKGRVTHAKLWLVNLQDSSIPDSEIKRYEKGEQKAKTLLRDTANCEVTSFNCTSRSKMVDELEEGDWIIECIKHKDGSITVWPPAQLLYIDQYIRNQKTQKERYVFHSEIFQKCQSLDWSRFRKIANSILSNTLKKPRTKPIRNIGEADDLLRLWTPAGQISKRHLKR
jgi:hypothetical protein